MERSEDFFSLVETDHTLHKTYVNSRCCDCYHADPHSAYLEMLEMNGPEFLHVSFTKYSGHSFQKDLRASRPETYEQFEVDFKSRHDHFWP